jgi:hypothetical protein
MFFKKLIKLYFNKSTEIIDSERQVDIKFDLGKGKTI